MSRLEKLREVEGELREMMRHCTSRAYPALSREYRAVLAEIEELDGSDEESDPIARIIANRKPAAD